MDYDVIVLGGGGAGLAAANTAAALGNRVLLVEVGDRLGGSTSLSDGVFYAADTKPQAEAGIVDSADAMFRYALALNQYRAEPALLRRYCDEGSQTLHWLMSLGVEFPPSEIYTAGTYSEMSGVPRCHSPKGYGAAVTGAMEAALSKNEVDVALRSRATSLIYGGTRVSGVEVDGTAVSAGAVVIATGGFGANPDLLEKYYPDAARHGDETWYIGSKHCVGDGLAMGQAAGADITGVNRGLLLPTPNIAKYLELPPCWIVLVNRDGRRFMNEAVGYGVMSGVIDAQPDRECFGVFDSTVFNAPPRDIRFARLYADGSMTSQWTQDLMQAALDQGRIKKADTLEGLAELFGIRADAIGATIANHNADAEEGVDNEYFKNGTMMHTVSKAPFYGVAFKPAILCFTSTGLRIDRNARVLSTSNTPIPGLFAAGETAGGVMGECYIGSGSSVAHVTTFGRIAGRHAAETVRAR